MTEHTSPAGAASGRGRVDCANYPTEHKPGALPGHCRGCHFRHVTHNADVLWEETKNVTQRAVDSAYGTDPRHGLLARAVADKVAYGEPVPLSLGRHFGRMPIPGPDRPEPVGQTVTEWNILDHGTPYLAPWTEDEDEASAYLDEATGPVISRERTTYPDHVTAWRTNA